MVLAELKIIWHLEKLFLRVSGQQRLNVEEGLKYLEIASEQGQPDATIFFGNNSTKEAKQFKRNLPLL